MENIINGNIADLNKNYKDWFIGKFVNESEFNSRNSKDFEIKWSKREKGYIHQLKDSVVEDITCNSMVICIYGKFLYSFLTDSGKFEDYKLENEGDYIHWSPDINHKVEMLEDSLLITIRWYKSD